MDYGWQAFEILRWGFVAAPLLAGLGKFFHFLVDWNKYLAPVIANFVGRSDWSHRLFAQSGDALQTLFQGVGCLF